MARDHARVNLDIWGDDDWLDLSWRAQHLYFVLYTAPQLSFCGAGPWHPGRLANRASEWTADDIELAAIELSERLFLFVDTETEEFLLRSWIKHDGLWRTPNMAVTVANARGDLASRTLRGVIVFEVAKLATKHPESTSWARPAVANMLSQNAIDPTSIPPYNPGPNGGGNPTANPASNPTAKGYGHPGSNPGSKGGRTPPPTPVTPTPEGGYVSGERYEGQPPPSKCSKHINETFPPPCGACRDARQGREAWDTERTRIAEEAKRVRRALAANCPLCDDFEWLIDVEPAVKCTHPQTESA